MESWPGETSVVWNPDLVTREVTTVWRTVTAEPAPAASAASSTRAVFMGVVLEHSPENLQRVDFQEPIYESALARLLVAPCHLRGRRPRRGRAARRRRRAAPCSRPAGRLRASGGRP